MAPTSRRTRAVLATGTAALLPGIIKGGHAFLMPAGFTSLQSLQRVSSTNSCDKDINIHYKPLFAVQYFGEDQWCDDDGEELKFDDAVVRGPELKKYFETSKRAVFSGAAIGTLIAINGAAGMSAGAEAIEVQSSSSEVPVTPVKSVSSSTLLNEQPAVTLPYLEKQIKAAEDAAISNSAPSTPVVTQATTTAAPTAPVVVAAQSQPVVASTNTAVAPTAPTAPVVVAAQSQPVVASTNTAVAPTAPTAPVVVAAQSQPVVASTNTAVVPTAPVVSKKIVVAAATPTLEKVTNTGKTSSPSLSQYTQDHIPGWIETGRKVYTAVEPKVAAGGQKLVAEVDKRVIPKIIEKEHQLLGEENSAFLDNTLSTVSKGGKMIAGMVGKVISFGVEGGRMVAKTTPEVISVGKQVYRTLDEKILPEVIDTSRKMKIIITKAIPEVVDTGKHAYTTIVPEVLNAEKQIASTMKKGFDIALPIVKQIENKIVPELAQIERNVLGYEQAAMLDKTVSEVAQQSHSAASTVGKTIPEILAAVQQTSDSIATTGRTVARIVPLVVDDTRHVYETVDKSVNDAISTTRDIAVDLDRAGGKAAYAIEGQVYGAADIMDKTLPTLLETTRQVAVTIPKITRTVETGSKAIIQDVSGFVADIKVRGTNVDYNKRIAKSKPKISTMFQDFTASVNDPNRMASL
jgi:hypothetical protein